MKVRCSVARALGWIALACTTGGLVVDPNWVWLYYTHWNLLILYAASVVALQSPKLADRPAELAIISAWATAIAYTATIILYPSRTGNNSPLFWALNSSVHYIPAVLSSAAFDPHTQTPAASLGALLALLLFYNITHDTAKLYDMPDMTLGPAILGSFVAAVLSFFIFLPGEYLSAQKVFW